MCELEENCIHIYTKFTVISVSETTGKKEVKLENLNYAFSNIGTIISNSRDVTGIINTAVSHSNGKHIMSLIVSSRLLC